MKTMEITENKRFYRFTLLHLALLALVLLFAAVSCTHSDAKKANEEKTAAPLIPAVEVFTMHKTRMTSALTVPGELLAFQQVDLYAKVNSFVQKLNADVGTEVQAGQLLATLEAPELGAQLAGAEARVQAQEALYNVSKSNYERLTEAAKTAGAVSAYDIDVALAKRNADYAQLQTAKASIREITDTKNYLLLKAPFSGVVTARNVSAGAYVGPSGRGSEQPLFTLQEHKKLRLAVAVPEAYVAYLHKAGIVKFRVKSLPEAQFTAQISRLAGALDTRLRAQRVEFDIPNENGKLLPGMIAEVSFTFAGTDNSLVVPKTALINSSEHLAVIRVAEGKARLVDVRTGRIAHDSVEIFGPLSEGDQLVKAAAEEIRDGSEVTIAKAGSK